MAKKTYTRDPFQYTGETLQNIPDSLLGMSQGVYDMATNPLETLQQVYDYAAHPMDTAGRVYGHYANRYRNLPVTMDTARRDPVGALMDFLPLAALRRGGVMPMEGEVLSPSGRPAPKSAKPSGRGGPTIEGREGITGPRSAPSLPGEMRGPVDMGTSYRPMNPFERNTANMAMQRWGAYNPEMAVTDQQRYAGPVGPRSEGMATAPNGFERNMVAAAQMRGGPKPQGYGQYGVTPYPSYFEEGGQGFRPSIDDYVDVNVVRNPERYYSQNAEDFVSDQMRAGNRGLMRHPYYGDVRASRPPYGEVPEGYVSPIERMPRPGINRRPVAAPVVAEEAPGIRAPYGDGGEGKGYFGNLPNPGIQPRAVPGRPGLPAMIPTGAVSTAEGRAMVPMAGRDMMPPGAGYAGADEMARLGYNPRVPGGYAEGGAVVPTEIPGEFYEVYGIGGPAGAGPGDAAPSVGPAGSPMAAGDAGGSGFPYGKAVAGAAIPLAAFYAWQNRDQPNNPLQGQSNGTALGRQANTSGRSADVPLPMFMQDVGQAGPTRVTPEQWRNYMGVGMPQSRGKAKGPLRAEGGARRKVQGVPVAVRAAQKKTPVPPIRPAELNGAQQGGGWSPNFNYDVTSALDYLTGQHQAEEGRKYQQAVEEYQRKYGPIYY